MDRLVKSGKELEWTALIAELPVHEKIGEVHGILGFEHVANGIPAVRVVVRSGRVHIGQKAKVVLHAGLVLLRLGQDVQV